MKQGKIMKRWTDVIDKLYVFGKSKCSAQTAARAILLACRQDAPPDEVYICDSSQDIFMRWHSPRQMIQV